MPAIEIATAAKLAPSVIMLLTPLFRSFATKVGNISDIALSYATNSFSDYYQRSIERNSYLTTLVFRNQRQKINELYIPLTLSTNEESYTIDRYPRELLDKYSRLLIVDTAGMGKSTLSKIIFLSAVEENEAIPVLIELRKIGEKQSILDYMLRDINGLMPELNGREDVSANLLLHCIENGQFLFIFDGFDEIKDTKKSEVMSELDFFKNRANNNKFIITSREESGLSNFADFQRLSIMPLQLGEAFSLIEKYSRGNETGARLINSINEIDNQSIHDFLSNPMLTSMLFKSFEYKKKIPLQKHIFYSQVYEALYYEHDISKDGHFDRDKVSDLNMDNLKYLLREIGYNSFQKKAVEHSKDEWLRVIETANKYCGYKDLSVSKVFDDLTSAVPLVCQDGINFRWAHKSMQEYFTALFLTVDSRVSSEKLYLAIQTSRSPQYWFNVLSLLFDMEPAKFKEHLIRPIINHLFDRYNSYQPNIKNLEEYEHEIEYRKRIVATNNILAIGIPLDSLSEIFEFNNKSMELHKKYDLYSKYIDDENDSFFGSATQSFEELSLMVVHHNFASFFNSMRKHDCFSFLEWKDSRNYVLAHDQEKFDAILDDGETSYFDNSDTNKLNYECNIIKVNNRIRKLFEEHNFPIFNPKKAAKILAEIEEMTKIKDDDFVL